MASIARPTIHKALTPEVLADGWPGAASALQPLGIFTFDGAAVTLGAIPRDKPDVMVYGCYWCDRLHTAPRRQDQAPFQARCGLGEVSVLLTLELGLLAELQAVRRLLKDLISKKKRKHLLAVQKAREKARLQVIWAEQVDRRWAALLGEVA
jgi:hypothetical protein